MASKYNIDITARDHTGEALKKVNESFSKLAKGTPLEEVSARFGMIHEKLGAFSGLSKGISGFGDASRIASGGIGEAAGETAALTGGMGLLDGALGVGALGLGAAAMAAAKFEIGYSAAGAEVGRFADVVGISAQQLQEYQLAGAKAGVSAQAMGQAIQGVASAMEDAGAGRNQAALMLMERLHIQLHRLPNGAVDAARGMDDLANAMQDQNPQARALIANTFGAAGALDFLIQKQSLREAQLDEAVRSGAIRSKAQIDSDIRMQESVVGLHQSWHRLLNALATRAIIPWLEPLMDELTAFLGVTREINGLGTSHQTVAANLGDILHGRATIDWSTGDVVLSDKGAKEIGYGSGGAAAAHAIPAVSMKAGSRAAQAYAYFKSQGWTDEQAAGIVANIQQESGFDPNIVGDHGRALGIGQWHPDRQKAFEAWAGHSMQASTYAEQLAFYQYELTRGSQMRAGRLLGQTKSAAAAAEVVSLDDERPAAGLGEAMTRGQIAEHIVHVEVNLKGAPRGTLVATRSSNPRVTAAAKVETSMQGVAA